MHVKKGDNVVVLTGKDKGKKGTIVKSLPKTNKVIVEGLNQVKKHQKPRRQNEKGTTITISLPIDVSNVRLSDKTAKTKVAKAKPASRAKKS
jgi:large subunit ribosomal protein L24